MSPADHINQLRAANRELDGKIACLLYLKDLSNLSAGRRDMERTAIRLERTNYELRKEKERFEAEREAGTDEGAGSLRESDGEGPSQKRKRGEK
jgi:hypothetical protein